jgi:phosphatidate cytidylyltransferase
MSRLLKRLLVFFIGIPAIVGLVLFLPHFRHLALNLIVTLFSGLGAVELSAMLEKKQMRISKIEAFILGALAPAALTLVLSLNCPEWIIALLIMTGAGWALMSRIFSGVNSMEGVMGYVTAGLTLLVYPGCFMYWLVKMASWENSGPVIFIFLMIVLGSDAAAWLAGSLFGKNNRGIIPASPNKSIAGFAGVIFGSIVVSGGAALIVPEVFPSLCMTIILGICTGIVAALGDLAESAIKRSCDTKDSGNLMLGRGGVLDSIDSIATAAPVFFLLFNLFFINS